MAGFGTAYRAFDRFQQRHAWLGFPLAVRQKYSDDQGGYLAATIAYYGFFSLFPLLLVFVTALGFLLRNHRSFERRVVGSALGQFPVIGTSIRTHALGGSALALKLGIVIALWSGMGVALASENAFNHIWGVPFRRRPDPFRSRARALALLLVLGGGTVVSTGLSGFATSAGSFGTGGRIGGVAISLIVNVGVFWLAFRLLTAADLAWRSLAPGAVLAAVAWEALQALGSLYVQHEVASASSTYGAFATVIGLLAWIYLGVQVTLLAAEVNVVRARGLWPRSFSAIVELPRAQADEAALRQRGEVEERRQDQDVQVRFADPRAPADGARDAGSGRAVDEA